METKTAVFKSLHASLLYATSGCNILDKLKEHSLACVDYKGYVRFKQGGSKSEAGVR